MPRSAEVVAPKEVSEQSSAAGRLSKVDSYESFPKNAKVTQKIYTYEEAASILNKTREDGQERPLAAYVGYGYVGRDRVVVYSGFWVGVRARVVLVDENGNYSLAPGEVDSVKEGAELAKKLGKTLVGASVLLDTEFMEKHRGKILVFSSRNSVALSKEELRGGWYFAGTGEDITAPKVDSQTAVIDAELKKIQVREAEIKTESEQLGQRKKELMELRPKAEQADKDEAQAKTLIRSATESRKAIAETLRGSA